MGEKLLAQRVLTMLREMHGRNGRVMEGLLEWAGDGRDWLWPDRVWKKRSAKAGGRTATSGAEILDWENLPRLAAEIDTAEPEPVELAWVPAVGALLDLTPFDREVLRVGAAFSLLPRLDALRREISRSGENMVALTGRLAGAERLEAAGRVRRSDPLSLGLLVVESSSYSGINLDLHWRMARLLEEGPIDDARLIAALAGNRQSAALEPGDFAEHAQAFAFLARLLRGAMERGAPGVNILIHGPPGTGKTELARTLAQSAGAELFAVGEADVDGEEPTRRERLHALTRAQRLLARRGSSLVLFDEMEDLFAEAVTMTGGGHRSGSKIFVNRLLEDNKVPVIWTSNAIDDVDPAHLRRLSYVHHMTHPRARARTRIAAHAAAAEGVGEAASGLASLLAIEPEAASIARAALRSAALAGGGAADAEAAGRSLLLGLRGGRPLPPAAGGGAIDLALYESKAPIAPLIDRLAAPGAASDFSLLLTGPPGTGKTALAAHLAERLDRPLTTKRASDLLSKWVGGTEAKIAAAFADARDEGSVLLFDEVDSLLLDRSDSRQSWEISQVNELLTWMDSHPLPFVAATNWSSRLDPAALRRFVFKIELGPLSGAAAERAWTRFFPGEAPPGLALVPGLTPGDFAVVARQLRYRPDAAPAAILRLLEAEARAKPERSLKIGF